MPCSQAVKQAMLKRLIEADLPLKEVSEQSLQEKLAC